MSPQETVNAKFAKDTLAPEAEEVIICLVEINHPSLTEPIRLSSDNTTFEGDFDQDTGEPVYCTVSNGNKYYHAQFSFVAPGLPENNTLPKAKFVVSIAPQIRQAIRNVHDSISMVASIVYASDPDSIISQTPVLMLTNVTYGAQIECELSIRHFLYDKVPRLKFMPSVTPGLFKVGVSA